MKRVISCVLLMLVLTSNAFALEVPTDTVVQNLNGSQQAIKTFTVSPEQDPAALIEEPFELEGYLYTFADIVKSENPVEEKRIHTEVITVETTKDDLALILGADTFLLPALTIAAIILLGVKKKCYIPSQS